MNNQTKHLIALLRDAADVLESGVEDRRGKRTKKYLRRASLKEEYSGDDRSECYLHVYFLDRPHLEILPGRPSVWDAYAKKRESEKKATKKKATRTRAKGKATDGA